MHVQGLNGESESLHAFRQIKSWNGMSENKSRIKEENIPIHATAPMAKANTALDMINFQCQGKATANMVIQTNIAIDISARIMDTLAMNPRSLLLSKSYMTGKHYCCTNYY